MKKSGTNLLNSRLLKYSLSAGAVLVGAKTANAQIWGIAPNTTLSTGQATYDISFNGNIRFTIKIFNSFSYHLVNLTNDTASASWVKRTNGRPKALSSGYVVNSTKSFANSQGRFADVKTTGAFISGTSFFNTDKYIGVRFKIASNTYYGWIRVHVNVSGNDLQSITIVSYAYEQTAGNSITADGTLPVELNNFSAIVNGDKVNLKWSTATEVNNYGFDIERSSANQSWEKVGFVAGHGNSNSPHNYTFTDQPTGGTSFSYRLKQIDNDGKYKYYDAISVNLDTPDKPQLLQNSPNPFNPSTAIKFYIPNTSDVTIRIYDMLGKEVTTLYNKQTEAGSHIVYWNGRDSYGKEAASGVYLYRLTAGNFTETKKMLMMK